MDAGAYGSCMSSNYNLRPKVIEILIDNDKLTVIANRENLNDMMKRYDICQSDDIQYVK